MQDHTYITDDEYINHTVVSNITPGALPVKLGALIGFDIAGIPGMMAGSLMTSIPGVFIMLGLLSCITFLSEGVLNKIEYASVGISAFIIFLLIRYMIKVMEDSGQNRFLVPAVLLMAGTALFTGGKEFRHLLIALGIRNVFTDSVPIFDISTVDILILVFFVIFFTNGKRRPVRIAAALLVSVFYVLIFGKSHFLDFGIGNTLFKLGILLMAGVVTVIDAKSDSIGNGKMKIDLKGAVWKSLPYLVLCIIFFVLCVVFANHDITYYMINGALSTVTSFGGGEAYLTVADGIFVSEGVVSTTEFYGQILPIANALPGSILVKILAGIGFSIGSQYSLLQGWLIGLFGLVLATAVSCIACVFIQAVYQAFSQLNIFKTLKLWILPVICGLLLSTITSMTTEMFRIYAGGGLSVPVIFAFVAVIYALIFVLHHRFHLHDVLQILIAATISLLIPSLV